MPNLSFYLAPLTEWSLADLSAEFQNLKLNPIPIHYLPVLILHLAYLHKLLILPTNLLSSTSIPQKYSTDPLQRCNPGLTQFKYISKSTTKSTILKQDALPLPCPLWKKEVPKSGPTPSLRKLLNQLHQILGLLMISKSTEVFIISDSKHEAINCLLSSWVFKNLSLLNYFVQFWNYAALSEINNEDVLINFVSHGNPSWPMNWIYTMDTVPSTMEDWYKKAVHFKIQSKIAWNITSCQNFNLNIFSNSNHNNNSNSTPKPPKDLNDIEVDVLSLKKLTNKENHSTRKTSTFIVDRKSTWPETVPPNSPSHHANSNS